MNEDKKNKWLQDGFSRRSVLGMGSAALAATFAALSANAQPGKARARQKVTIPPVTPARRTSHFSTKIPIQTRLRRRTTEMSGLFGTPLIWHTSEFKKVAGPTRLHSVSCRLQRTSLASTCA